ncbi:ciliary microtubule inner protein 2C [Melopsittacus undulatus]|uniref:ciliary microtubule inner protein 2C n=1 Tax=Melopsittacus undulatus TaxID=13146 RepID=UPI00146F7565|nr:protein FAM166C [Melopsittacus undulatus]
MRYPPGLRMVTTCQAEDQDVYPHIPLQTSFKLDGGRSQELSRFYQLAQQHRDFYRDRSGMLYIHPFFVLPVKEKERYPHPLDIPLLSAKTHWHLRRVSPLNVRTYQTFPSGKRISTEERQNRNAYFEYRA